MKYIIYVLHRFNLYAELPLGSLALTTLYIISVNPLVPLSPYTALFLPLGFSLDLWSYSWSFVFLSTSGPRCSSFLFFFLASSVSCFCRYFLFCPYCLYSVNDSHLIFRCNFPDRFHGETVYFSVKVMKLRTGYRRSLELLQSLLKAYINSFRHWEIKEKKTILNCGTIFCRNFTVQE